MRSPGSAQVLFSNAAISSSLKNLAIGDLIPSSSTTIHARPFAPYVFTNSPRLSISFLLKPPHPLALIALTLPPPVTASENTLKPHSLTRSDTSTSSIPNLMSGLSEPNLSMASLYGILGNGVSISTPSASLKAFFINPSFIVITSSTSTKDISRSSCVNSGCLSALRSSSLKHLATWK